MAQTRVGIRNGALFSQTSSIITDGLVLHLDAGNTSSYSGTGTIWNDLTSNNNDGTLTNGPIYDSGNGGSISFDGVNDYVSTSNNLDIIGNSKRTIEIWFYPISSPSRQTLLSYGGTGTGTRFQIEYNGYRGAPNNIYFVGWNRDIYTTSTLPLNTWSQVLLTYNGGGISSDDGIKIYYNGISQTLLGGTDVILNTTNSICFFGYDGISNRLPYDGNISNIKIYNRALTDSEVLQNYNSTKDRFGL
jgi:hypothetical protein